MDLTLHARIGSHSLDLILLTSLGSENKNRGIAKLMNPHLNDSMSVNPYANFRISALTHPVIIAVVVAIAGMIFPAMIFVFYYVFSVIL